MKELSRSYLEWLATPSRLRGKNPRHHSVTAIRLPGGKVFVGNFHGHALEKAADAGYPEEKLEKAELGFSHADGSAFYVAATIPIS